MSAEHTAEEDLVLSLFGAVIRATCPDDPCGHLPNCGYTNEHQTCGCSEWGKRLHDAITACVIPSAVTEPGDDA